MTTATLPMAESTPIPTLRVLAPSCARNALTVDVEEYFHAEVFAGELTPADWPRLERRSALFLETIGELLARHESKATFFVLGWTVDYLAPLLRHLASQGHEIACHGFDHQHISRQTPQQLREDLKRARGLIEDRIGVRPRGYRAPTFSITRETAWALDVVIEQGFQYDSSIFPIHHDRYGVPNAPTAPFWATAPSGSRILEFPPLTLDIGIARIPVGGGGYLRLLPGAIIRKCLAAAERRDAPTLLYVHPWELDAQQPMWPAGRLSRWRHTVNLDKTEAKLDRLLRSFRFDTAWRVLSPLRVEGNLPTYDLETC